MSQAFGASGKRRKPTINITSLIDVMFLLLIFFMVSSTFKEEDQAIEVTLPQAGTGATQELDYQEIIVTADGTYHFAGETMGLAELKERIDALVASDPNAIVGLRADGAAEWQPVVSAMDILRQSGVREMSIPTDPMEEAPTGP